MLCSIILRVNEDEIKFLNLNLSRYPDEFKVNGLRNLVNIYLKNLIVLISDYLQV